MDRNFPELKFKWPWRPYQKRVLDALDEHLHDEKLHLVAAPGAGKTSLGLELFRRIGEPALVLSPTRTIRDQWLNRLNDFLSEDKSKPWASKDLRNPNLFTSVTYQALHTIYRDKSEEPDSEEDEVQTDLKAPKLRDLDAVINDLKSANIKTLILDEAHHLTQEWWKALSYLLEKLEIKTLVSLTATPPYEVTHSSWQKYEDLCGPIDEEISIPELVKSGTLCAHQDYVYAVCPSKPNNESLELWDIHTKEIIELLESNEVFKNAITTHPWQENNQPDEILENTELLVALIIFNKKFYNKINQSHLSLLDCKEKELPKIDNFWWDVIIKNYLFNKDWPSNEFRASHVKELKKELRKRDLLYRRELRINISRKLKRELALTSSKVNACKRIYQLEKKARGDSLRQVVLADYIREGEVRQLGVYPVFREIVKNSLKNSEQIATLTGRLVLLHKSKISKFTEIVPENKLIFSEGPKEFPEFISLSLKGENSEMVAAMTKMLELGQLECIVGTHALLGEGWDAPVINSLILASTVGSYVLSNQMRGRAIRSVKANPEKVSSIWHLACLSFHSPQGLEDYWDLSRRFEAFPGLDYKKNIIQGGIERLHLPNISSYYNSALYADSNWLINQLTYRYAAKVNKQSKKAFKKIGSLKECWQSALVNSDLGKLIPIADIDQTKKIRPFILSNTLLRAIIIFAVYLLYIFYASLDLIQAGTDISLIGIIFLGLFFYYCLKPLYQVIKLWLFCLPVDGSVKQISRALRDALCEADLIKTDWRRARVLSEKNYDGSFYICLTGGTFYEQALFADCIKELLGPVENPRYLIVRKEKRYIGQESAYHAVPTPLAASKEKAEIFLKCWKRRFDDAELIYTRTTEGRKALLECRLKTHLEKPSAEIKRRDRWV